MIVYLDCALQEQFLLRGSRRGKSNPDTVHQVLYVVIAGTGHEHAELWSFAVSFKTITVFVAVLHIRQPTRKALVRLTRTQLSSCQLVKGSRRVGRVSRV